MARPVLPRKRAFLDMTLREIEQAKIMRDVLKMTTVAIARSFNVDPHAMARVLRQQEPAE